MYTCCR